MKPYLLLLFSVLLISNLSAQASLSEDFEAYNDGDLITIISEDWKLWPKGTDSPVTSEEAASGKNSLKLVGGKNTDLYYPFKRRFTAGAIQFSMDLLIPEKSNGYFSLQARQSIASLALWPDGEGSVFYVDNISFEHQGTAKNMTFLYDGAIEEILDVNSELTKTTFAGINGEELALSCTIENIGEEQINSFSLSVDADGRTTDQEYKVNLPAGLDTTVTLDQSLTYDGDKSASITLTKINGVADENLCNNNKQFEFRGFTMHPAKKVWIEEATGTWCPWCPRGEVYMTYLSENYPHNFVGIAVHNRDPMETEDWIGEYGKPGKFGLGNNKKDKTATGLSQYLRGFPSVLIDRTEVMDPSLLAIAFLEYASQEPQATLTHSAVWNEQSRELEVVITTDFNSSIVDEAKLVVGLTEDKLSGTGPDWAQQNNFAGGANGKMGGYEIKRGPVPAEEMEYNDVARHLFTPFDGEAMQRDAFKQEGSSIVRTFTHRIPGDWNLKNMHIVSALIIGDSGVHNAQKTSVEEAVRGDK